MIMRRDRWSTIFAILAFTEVFWIVVYSFAIAMVYLAGKTYWPVWVLGTFDVSAMQAAMAVQAWWYDDPIGVSSFLAMLFMGFSLWLNIINLTYLYAGNTWTNNNVYNGITYMPTNASAQFYLNVTGPAPSSVTTNVQFWVYIFFVMLQLLIVLFHLGWIFMGTKQEIQPTQFNNRALCNCMSLPHDRAHCSMFDSSCCVPPGESMTCVNFWICFIPCFGNDKYRDRIDSLKMLAGFCGFLIALLLLSEYTLAATLYVPAWPGLDSPNAIAIIGLFWAMFPMRRPEEQHARDVNCFESRSFNYRFWLIVVIILPLGIIVSFWNLSDQVATQSGLYLNTYSAPVVNNVHAGSSSVSIVRLNGHNAEFAQYILATDVANMLIGCTSIVALGAYLLYAVKHVEEDKNE